MPKSLILPVLSEAHGTAIAGHWADKITINNIMASYLWLTMVADIIDFISKCPTCYIQKDKKGLRSRTKITPLSTPPHPNYRIHADLVSPLRSTTEHQWVLSITDTLTKYVVLLPLKTKEAQEVAQAIVNYWIIKFGPFLHMVTDNGGKFTAKVTKSLADYLTIYSNSFGTDLINFLPSLQYSSPQQYRFLTSLPHVWGPPSPAMETLSNKT